MSDIRELNARAVRRSVEIVDHVKPEDLTMPTPCGEWTVAELLGHMIVQHRGFAAAARGDGADLAHWEFAPAGEDAVERYREAADDVLAAYADLDDALDAPFALPEITRQPTFPARFAIGFHFIDYVVHGWDVARALGLDFELEPALEATALKVAFAVPDGDARTAPGAAFAAALPGQDDGPALDRILRYLGRSPEWPAA